MNCIIITRSNISLLFKDVESTLKLSLNAKQIAKSKEVKSIITKALRKALFI